MAVPPFVGRTDELGFLLARLADAGQAHPQTVLVEAPGGLGKSALLAAFSRSLDTPPLHASGDEAETFLQFGVLLQLLDARTAAWSDPFAAGAHLLEFLDHRHDHPTVFVVDDAHLADAESLTALTFALRRLQADRVLAVFAVRDPERLPAGLLRLVDAQDGRLRLGGLTDAEVIALGVARGGERLTGAAASQLREHTGGNPLYLSALIDELPRGGVPDGRSLPAPESYASLVSAQLSSLSDQARSLARAGAVLADGVLVDVAATVAGVAAAPEVALEELTITGLVTCTYAEDGWRMSFGHPLTKAAVYDDLRPTERVRLHAECARLLHGEESLLHRVAAATGPDPQVAAGLARAARARAEREDNHRAAELALTAARLSPPGPDADERAMDAVELFLLAGDVSAAQAAAGPLATMAPSGRLFHLQAKLAQLSGQPGRAEELALAAWERSDELGPDGRGRLAAILAQLCNVRGDGAAAAEWCERALAHELPSDLGDSTLAARALGLAIAGRLDEALAGLDLPDSAGVDRSQFHQLCVRGALRAAVDDLDGARADLSRLTVASGRDLAPQRLVGMGALADVEYRLGRWDDSLMVAAQATSLAEDTDQRWVLGYLHAVTVLVAAARGAWAEAEASLATAVSLATELGDAATFAVCEDAAVHLAWCRGEPEQVVDRSALLLSLRGGVTHEPGLLGWPAPYVSALVSLGRLDEAAEEIAGFEAVARARQSRSRLAALARVRGELATARRDNDAARAAFEEAIAVGRGVATALDAALADASYGRFLRRRGERRAAVARLRSAREQLAGLGAGPWVARCDEELAACGAELGEREPTVSALTPQEQIVAMLVCQGLTNQQVARQLVLSVKTVGYHLGNVYTKLGVHSRTQLQAQLASG